MKRKPRFLSGIVALLVVVCAAGCGGKTGVGGITAAARTDANGPTVTGTVSKGPVVNGTVNIYSVGSSGKNALLTTVATDTNGRYTAHPGNYTGPVLIEAYGNYTDEATGQHMSIPAAAPLRAAVPSLADSATVAVTPLTEFAVMSIGKKVNATTIAAANARVAQVYKFDITATQPVAPAADAIGAVVVTQAQKDYTIALAGVSQMMADYNWPLASVISELNTGFSTTTPANVMQTCMQIQASIISFLANTNNRTGIADIGGTTLSSVGDLTRSVFRISVNGGQPTDSIKGIHISIALPANAAVVSDKAGNVLPYSLALSGEAPQTSYVVSKLSPAANGVPAMIAIVMASADGFRPGEFATLTVFSPSGSPLQAADFITSGFNATDENGLPIPDLKEAVTER